MFWTKKTLPTRNFRATNTSKIAFHVSHWCSLFFVFFSFSSSSQCQLQWLSVFFFNTFFWNNFFFLSNGFYNGLACISSLFMSLSLCVCADLCSKQNEKKRFISDGNTFSVLHVFVFFSISNGKFEHCQNSGNNIENEREKSNQKPFFSAKFWWKCSKAWFTRSKSRN